MLFDKIIPQHLIQEICTYFSFFNLLQVWWAASDLGWVVGHSYICYGPLLHGNSTILYEVCPCGQALICTTNCSVANNKKYHVSHVKSVCDLLLLAWQTEYIHIWLMTPQFMWSGTHVEVNCFTLLPCSTLFTAASRHPRLAIFHSLSFVFY